MRVVKIDGEPWFAAVDVCQFLGLSNPSVAVAPLTEGEKAKAGLGKGSPANVISESGLYKLVLRSDKPEAKDFQNWVTKVVLPAIRKDGGYIHGEEHVVSGAMSEDELVISVIVTCSAETVR